ncbi:enolase-like [Syzygium oleosum]|uniref:enolase-like n=1 Tax=Syzygium oleosum TaxID=219896 RepID=UPI0024BA397B|nr:enolase-like [Syzygium oleosum]
MKYGQAATNVHDAGGFIKENEEGLELLKEAIENTDYNDKVFIGMEVAASEFHGPDRTYDMNFKEENNDGSQKIPGDALGNVYKSFAGDYAIVSIEGPFYQDDLEHYARMTHEIGEHVQLVGGDLLGTNLVRLEKAINEKICNALLLKVDQIGSVTESIEAVKMSKIAGWGVMASCSSLGQRQSIADTFLSKMFCFGECTKLRSGGTEDAFIADLSVGLATGQIKTGAPRRSERQAKYNRLLQIEKELGAEAVYAGADFRKPVEPY